MSLVAWCQAELANFSASALLAVQHISDGCCHNDQQSPYHRQDIWGCHLRVFSLGQTGKTEKFNIFVKTTIGMHNALDEARGMEFPSSDVK